MAAQPSASAEAPAPTLAVEAHDLVRRFGEVEAVTGVDLEVRPGTILGIIGPSGSGKTTTIRMLIGTLGPTSGDIRVLGDAPAHLRRRTRERIGYMPQHFMLYPDLTVGENVDFAASLFGLLLFRRSRRKRQVLELLGLWAVRGRRAGALSGGMQRRLSLACALVHEPSVLVLDEPTAGLDPILRRTVWDELHRLRDRGVAIIATTQYVTEAEECDDVALIADGRVLARGTPDELRRRAIGGEELLVTTEGPIDIDRLAALDHVRSARQTGRQEAHLIVDDAGVATPAIIEAVTANGVEVGSVRESRPSFEEVFTRLVDESEPHREDGQSPPVAIQTAPPSADPTPPDPPEAA